MSEYTESNTSQSSNNYNNLPKAMPFGEDMEKALKGLLVSNLKGMRGVVMSHGKRMLASASDPIFRMNM